MRVILKKIWFKLVLILPGLLGGIIFACMTTTVVHSPKRRFLAEKATKRYNNTFQRPLIYRYKNNNNNNNNNNANIMGSNNI